MSKKRTQEEYIAILNEDGNYEYELIEGEVYINNKHRLQTLHKKCGKITSISPRNFISGQRCFQCSKEERIQQKREEKHQQFVKFLQEDTNGEYVLAEGEFYINSQEIMQLIHVNCNSIYKVRPYDFKSGSRCPKCRDYSAITKTHEQFMLEFKEESKDEYQLVKGEVYKNSKSPIQVIHTSCKFQYTTTPNHFLRGVGRCPKCRKEKKVTCNEQKSTEFKERVKSLVGDEYIVVDISEYQNLKSTVKMVHSTCSHEFTIVAGYFVNQNSRCPQCSNKTRKSRLRKKKTHVDFNNEVLIKGNGEYEVTEDSTYVNNSTYIRMRHKTCSYEYDVLPSNFLSGRRCPCCSNIKRRLKNQKTHEIFVNEVFELVGKEYSVLSTYINSKEKVKIQHNTCGYKWEIVPQSFLSGTKCPSCVKKENAKKRRKSIDEFKKEVYELVQDEYVVKEGETYINNCTPIKMIHRKCNHEYPVRPGNFLKNRRCPACKEQTRGEKIKKGLEVFKQQVLELGNGNYELTKNAVYTNTDTHIEMKHILCGHVWNIVPSAFIRGVRCPNCNGGVKRNHDEFMEEFKAKAKSEYSVVHGERYINVHTPIRVTHHECNLTYKVTPANFLSGKRCPKCASLGMSKGEKEITDILERNKINFIQQQTLEGCVYKRPLRFDFGIYVDNSLKAVVEYNGLQHYEEVDYFGGKKTFLLNQKRDKIKRNFCKKKGIPLIEIRYDEEILPTLSKKLSKIDVHI